MEKRPFGKTDMQVTVLGFGGAEIGFEGASPETVAQLLHGALDAGLNVIDTAECYMQSEELIGQAVELTLPRARARRMGVIAKRPLANVAWRYPKKPDDSYIVDYWSRLRALQYPFLAADGDAPVATALRFTLTVPGVHTAIVGTTRPERWRDNAALLEAGPLPSAEFQRIRKRWNDVAKRSWVGQV